MKVAFEAKSLSFAQWLLAFYVKERGMPSTVPDTKKFLKEVARTTKITAYNEKFITSEDMRHMKP